MNPDENKFESLAVEEGEGGLAPIPARAYLIILVATLSTAA